jgi:AcrR family transcriptional regulator
LQHLIVHSNIEWFIDYSAIAIYVLDMSGKDAIREQIVQAARQRFLHYGYAKTTMAEIARDLGMSAGNLYRYFPSKLDIAMALAEEYSDRNYQALAGIPRRTDLTPREKLRAFLFTGMEMTYRELEADPKIYEIARIIKQERPDYANRELARQRALLVDILKEGNETGDFKVTDLEFAAEMIQSATMKYKYPQLWSHLTLDKLRRELEGVFELCACGLSGGYHCRDTRNGNPDSNSSNSGPARRAAGT